MSDVDKGGKIHQIPTKEEFGQLRVRLTAALDQAEKVQARFENIIAALSAGSAHELSNQYLEEADHFAEALRNGRGLAGRVKEGDVSKESLRTAIVDVKDWTAKICALGGIKEQELPPKASSVAES